MREGLRLKYPPRDLTRRARCGAGVNVCVRVPCISLTMPALHLVLRCYFRAPGEHTLGAMCTRLCERAGSCAGCALSWRCARGCMRLQDITASALLHVGVVSGSVLDSGSQYKYKRRRTESCAPASRPSARCAYSAPGCSAETTRYAGTHKVHGSYSAHAKRCAVSMPPPRTNAQHGPAFVT